MVNFCPTCKNILMPKKTEDGQVVFRCNKCESNYEGKEIKLTSKTRDSEKKRTVVIENTLQEATIPAECPNCQKNVAAVQWQVQTRSADEPPTTFYRCSVCQQTWRDYGG